MALLVARWRNGGLPGNTATRFRHVCGMLHGSTMWQVARWNENSLARFPGYVTGQSAGRMVAKRIGNNIVDGAMDLRSPHICSVCAHITYVLEIFFKDILLLLNHIIIFSKNIIDNNTRQ